MSLLLTCPSRSRLCTEELMVGTPEEGCLSILTGELSKLPYAAQDLLPRAGSAHSRLIIKTGAGEKAQLLRLLSAFLRA